MTPVRAPAAHTTVQMDGQASALRGSLRATEKHILLSALRAGETRRDVAERLGISPRTLRYKLAQLRSAGIDVPAA